MERKQFLRSLGAGAAFAIVFPCLGSCSKDSEEGDGSVQPTNVDFTIDLNSSEAARLADNGGFIRVDLVVIARNLQGEYVAATQICSHQNYAEVVFAAEEGGIFYCDVHGSKFSQTGTPINPSSATATKALKIYNTSLEGSMLRVFE